MRQKKKRLATPLPRKLHIEGETWTYKPGSVSKKTVVMNPQRTKKWVADISDLYPDFDEFYDPHEDEDALDLEENKNGELPGICHKYPVTPSLVKSWIIKSILAKK